MKLIHYTLLTAISIFFIACNNDETNSINQDFKLKSNLEYGNSAKVGEELKIGVVVDSIDTAFEGNFVTSINTNDPNNCAVTFNNQSLLSTDKLDHNYKTAKTLWLQFKAREAGDYIITATVSNGAVQAKQVEIKITVSEYVYIINVTCNETEGSILGAGTYTKGNTVSIQAVPKNGYEFEGWYQQGSKLNANNPFTFPASENRDIEARFEKSIFKVEVEIEGEGTVTGINSYPKGSNVILDAAPKQYWQFVGWYNQNNVLLSQNARYTINNLNENTMIKAKFIASVYVKFYLDFEGSAYTTACSDDRRTVTDNTALKIKAFTYKNNQQQGYTFQNESLVINFDYSLQGVWYTWQQGNRNWACSYDINRILNGRTLTLYKASEIAERYYPDSQFFMAHINYLKNVKLSKSITADDRMIILDNVVESKKDGKITYYSIPQ